MPKKALATILSENLRYFMQREDCAYPNPNALATATKGAVSANTVRNILNPKKRTTTATKPDGVPTLDKLEALAKKLPKCEMWMLVHPELQRVLAALEMYGKIEADYSQRHPEQTTNEGVRRRETQRERA